MVATSNQNSRFRANGHLGRKYRSVDAAVTSSAITASAAGLLVAIQLQLGLILQILIPLGIAITIFMVWCAFALHSTRREIVRLGEQLTYLDDRPADPLAAELLPGSFEVYLRYKVLMVSEFGELLVAIDDLYKYVYGLLYLPTSQFGDMEAISHSNTSYSSDDQFLRSIEELLSGNPDDRLEIDVVVTGDSITFRIKTGWLPNVATEDGDFVVGVPKGVAAIAVAGSLLGVGVSKATTSIKEITESWKNIQEVEIALQKSELETDYLRLQIEELGRKLETTPKDIDEAANRKLEAIKDLTVRNREIKGIKVRNRFFRGRRFR